MKTHSEQSDLTDQVELGSGTVEGGLAWILRGNRIAKAADLRVIATAILAAAQRAEHLANTNEGKHHG